MKKHQNTHSDNTKQESLHSDDSDHRCQQQIHGFHIWSDRQFIQMWDAMRGLFTACIGVLLVILFEWVLEIFFANHLHPSLTLLSPRFLTISAVSFIVFYILYAVFQKSVLVTNLVREQWFSNIISNDDYDPSMPLDLNIDTEESYCINSLHVPSQPPYNSVHLFVDEGRFRKLFRKSRYSSIDGHIHQILNNSHATKNTSIRTSLKLTYSSRALYPFGFALAMLAFASTAFYPFIILLTYTTNMFFASLLGATLGSASLLIYIGLREIGIFPLPLWRGECSLEETRVCNFFRWRTFKPGRDLAIVRFTSNNEADIAFIGADGSHATARAGGKYLQHFIACWAAKPVVHADPPSDE